MKSHAKTLKEFNYAVTDPRYIELLSQCIQGAAEDDALKDNGRDNLFTSLFDTFDQPISPKKVVKFIIVYM